MLNVATPTFNCLGFVSHDVTFCAWFGQTISHDRFLEKLGAGRVWEYLKADDLALVVFGRPPILAPQTGPRFSGQSAFVGASSCSSVLESPYTFCTDLTS